MPKGYEDRYRATGERHRRDQTDDRGYVNRAGDEVRPWFGDEDADQRRRTDQRRDREREWREWEHPASARAGGEFRRGEPTSRYREAEWSPREREWRDYDRDLDPYGRDWRNANWYGPRSHSEFAGDRYWSPYETGPEPFRHPVDMAGTPAVRGTGFRGRGPKGYQRSDERIYEDICERLTDADVDAGNIEVKVAGGEVTLSGAVGDRRDRRHAEDIAEEVAGVRDVHNNLRVVSAADYLP